MLKRNLKRLNSETFADCVSMKLKNHFDNLEHTNKDNIDKVSENFVQKLLSLLFSVHFGLIKSIYKHSTHTRKR